MSAENLWGEIPKTGTLKTPIAILREQASLLGDATNNLLVADVTLHQDRQMFISDLFVGTFRIVAPALDDYRLDILQVKYPLDLYPLEVAEVIGDHGQMIRCEDEAAFKAALKGILSSERVHRVIESLLSQSQAA